MSETFENFKEFKEKYPQKAEQLLYDVEEGEWQNDYLEYYDSISDYAEYEVEEGWYAALGIGISSTDYNGAPLLFDFIDFDALGYALAESWDDSCHYQFSDDSVITTSTGW